jgi:MAE_28990/MAE_18760-like HEPN
MSTWNQDFQVRTKEIENYFKFLEKLSSPNAEIKFVDDTGAQSTAHVDAELLKTLKAAGFLLLYNLIEAAMRNGVVAIFDELKQKKTSFDDVRAELKKVAISNVKKHGAANLYMQINNVASEILTSAFDSEEIFSGNVDARKVRETAEEYGFSSATDGAVTRHGSCLLSIKTNRNDLGHGDKSFGEVGREYDVADLVVMKREAVAYVGAILSNIHDYISNKRYLAANASPHGSIVAPGPTAVGGSK